MSSMVNKRFIPLAALLSTGLTVSMPLAAQQTTAATASEWDQARSNLVARQPGRMSQAISRWEQLTANSNFGFDDYAGFILAYPGFPREERLRDFAEKALDNEPVTPDRLVVFFDKHPPLTNSARARYALALNSLNRPEATEEARKAWRSGTMSGPSEAYMTGLFSSQFTLDDHDARMDALLWASDAEAAQRQINMVSPSKRQTYTARLTSLSGSQTAPVSGKALSDPGYVYNLVQSYRKSDQTSRAVSLLTTRPAFAVPAMNPEDFVAEMLTVAKKASARDAQRIAASVDDLFAPGTDISEGSFRLRDKYTDLMWLGGTKALWSLGDGMGASQLFYRYGMAAKTPLTRSKGLYWAGKAASQVGNRSEAERYYTEAARYADQYYGQLAISALGRPMPTFGNVPNAPPKPDQKAGFSADPVTLALRTIAAQRFNWKTERAFFEQIAENAKTPAEMAMVADLVAQLRLDEFAVVAGATAPENGLSGFERLGHPTVATPSGTDWTMVHAIARQESEFDRNRISHAGARGMMQLMPGTAREQAGKLGMNYMSASLTGDTQYNIRLGDSYFKRMLRYYGGSYPLAIGAYNAGPGRVNQWLRLNGDPRTGAVDYQTWIEKIPANFETRYYIMRVLGNAVAYDNMNPDKAPGGRPRTIADFLR